MGAGRFGEGYLAGGLVEAPLLEPGFGCEAWVVFRGHRGHPGEDFPKILKRVEPTATAGFDHGEHDGAAFASFRVSNEEPVLLAHGSGSDGILIRCAHPYGAAPLCGPVYLRFAPVRPRCCRSRSDHPQ